MTLEEYLKQNIEKGIIDFSIRANVDPNGSVSLYVHPDSKDGSTLDFIVHGNELELKC